MKKLLENVFYQLIFIYTIFILLIALGFLGKYTLQFHILGFLIGFVGVIVLYNSDNKEIKDRKWIYLTLFLIGFVLIFTLRLLPYANNDIPLGYDAGLYKYGIENGLENKDQWIRSGGMEPGFLYLMESFDKMFDSSYILIYIFIIFNAILGLAVFVCAKEYFGTRAAVISLILYAVSVVQFKVFTYMYYKNIIGLGMMLFSIYIIKKMENTEGKDRIWYMIALVLCGAILGAIHRPSFYIFGISYLLYCFISPIKNRSYNFNLMWTNIIVGVLVVAIALTFYLNGFMDAILQILPYVGKSFISPGESPGTFISFFQYQFLVLAYIPFAIIGFSLLWKRKKSDVLVVWILINLAIVYFQFFFFNRFIIHLDIALILVSGVGFDKLLKEKKIFGIAICLALIFALLLLAYKEANSIKPLIGSLELENIKKIDSQIEKSASVMALSSEYSPWVLGYGGRRVIAPGLFDENRWSEGEWNRFWNSRDVNETREMMNIYSKPIYMFSGTKKFNNSCFEVTSDNEMLYRYGG